MVDSGEQGVSNKNIGLFKMCVISVKTLGNICVIRTIKQFACGICSLIDKLNLIDVVSCTYGDDSVMVYFENESKAKEAKNTLLDILE